MVCLSLEFNIPSRLRKMAIVQADKSTKKEIKAKRTGSHI